MCIRQSDCIALRANEWKNTLPQFPKPIYRLPPFPPTILACPRRSISYRQAADGMITWEVGNMGRMITWEMQNMDYMGSWNRAMGRRITWQVGTGQCYISYYHPSYNATFLIIILLLLILIMLCVIVFSLTFLLFFTIFSLFVVFVINSIMQIDPSTYHPCRYFGSMC